jgi:hypothetical protein
MAGHPPEKLCFLIRDGYVGGKSYRAEGKQLIEVPFLKPQPD